LSVTEHAFFLCALAIVASIAFAIWQNSWAAGVFMFCALAVLDQRP
jgi:hypothetical protein